MHCAAERKVLPRGAFFILVPFSGKPRPAQEADQSVFCIHQ